MPTDPTPPLTAVLLAVAERCFSSGDSGTDVEAIGWELLAAHAALTAQLAACRAELFEASQAGELLDAARRELAQRTAERDALKRAVVEMAIPYEALRMDGDSRKWIAPSVWKMIIAATEQGRAILAAPTEG